MSNVGGTPPSPAGGNPGGAGGPPSTLGAGGASGGSSGGNPGGAPGGAKPSSRDLASSSGAKDSKEAGSPAGERSKAGSGADKESRDANRTDANKPSEGAKNTGSKDDKAEGGKDQDSDKEQDKSKDGDEDRSKAENAARQGGEMAAKAGADYLTGGAASKVEGALGTDVVGGVGRKFGSLVYVGLGFLMLAIVSLAGSFSIGGDRLAGSPGTVGGFAKLPTEAVRAYRAAVMNYDDDQKYGGRIPWGLLAATAELASEHGKLSPYLEDLCDRNPKQPMQRVRPDVTPAGCGDKDASSFPEVTPAIGGDAARRQPASGPFLILPGAVSANPDMNPQDISSRSSYSDPATATEFIADQIDKIRRQMVDKEGRVAPVSGDIAGAKQFWGDVLSRLPVADASETECAIPNLPYYPDQAQIGVAVTQVWRCELLRQELFYIEPALSKRRIVDNAVELQVTEALGVAWLWSALGQGLAGVAPGCQRTATTTTRDDGTTVATESAPTAAVAATEPAGVFPLDKETFDKFAPTAGSDRCSAASNIVAAVRAFVSTESIDWGPREGATYQKAVGGWSTMPWVLGDEASREELYQNGPWHRFEPWGRDKLCAQATETWVTQMLSLPAVFDGLDTLLTLDANLNKIPDSMEAAQPTLMAAVSANDPRGRGKACGERNDGSVERYAASVAVGRQTVRSSNDVFDDGNPDGDVVTPDASGVAPAPVVPVVAADVTYRGIAVWLDVLAAASPRVSDAPFVGGVDIAVARLSVNGHAGSPRPFFNVPASARVVLSLTFAGILSPLVENDPVFNEDITSEQLQAALDSVLSGNGVGNGALQIPPAALIDAVNKAVEVGKKDPANAQCTLDAGLMLGFAYTESRGSWVNIQSNGDLVPRLVSGAPQDKTDNDGGYFDGDATKDFAVGVFQMAPGTWIGNKSQYPNTDPKDPLTWGGSARHGDGNDDGVQDPNNVYDAALGAYRQICANAHDRDLLSWGPQFVESLAAYVMGGSKWNSNESMDCYGTPRTYMECTEWLARKKYDSGLLYRAWLTGGLGESGSFPPGMEGAVAWARQELLLGRLYSGDANHRTGQEWKLGDPIGETTNGSLDDFGHIKTYCVLPNVCTVAFLPGTRTYDCSGFALKFWERVGVRLRYGNSRTMQANFPPVFSPTLALPGDLLISDQPNDDDQDPDHVRVYVGHGRMIESRGSVGLIESDVNWAKINWIVRPTQ